MCPQVIFSFLKRTHSKSVLWEVRFSWVISVAFQSWPNSVSGLGITFTSFCFLLMILREVKELVQKHTKNAHIHYTKLGLYCYSDMRKLDCGVMQDCLQILIQNPGPKLLINLTSHLRFCFFFLPLTTLTSPNIESEDHRVLHQE